MNMLTDIEPSVDENVVARRMKSGPEQKEAVRALIRQEIRRCLPLFHPRAVWEVLPIRAVEQNRVTLENGVVFSGAAVAGKLAGCSRAVVTLCTVGAEIDGYIRSCFDTGDYLRGMTADCIALSALESAGRQLWQRLVDDIQGTELGMTARFSPGDGGWALEEQQKIAACLPGDDTGVTLTASGMLEPVKSVSAVYGLGRGIGIARAGHVCDECPVKNCAYRIRRTVDVTIGTGGERAVYPAEPGRNLADILRAVRPDFLFPCGGQGTCGKCRVTIRSGAPAPTPEEQKLLTGRELREGVRLACRVQVRGPMALSPGVSGSEFAILTDAAGPTAEPDPSVVKRHLKLTSDGRPMLARIAQGLGLPGMAAGLPALRSLAPALGKAEGSITVTALDGTMIDIEAGDTESACYGAAVDIGTTTVVCYLTDLRSGRTVDTEARANRQGAFGADVISRISYTTEHADGVAALRELIVGQINDMVDSLCTRNGVRARHIYHMTVAGNTVMTHLFLGLPVRSIAAAPFEPVTTAAMDLRAADVGIHTGGMVSVLPGIAAYVGGDITAGILACGMADSQQYSLLMDMGTNGELALGNRERILTCAVAAGPAFEGGNISQGVGGVEGAICRVSLSGEKIYETIGGARPVGICGSGVLDAVSGLLRAGVIDATGRMAKTSADPALAARLEEIDGARQFVLADSPRIALTQKDVRQVQLAKAAFSAGIRVLLDAAGVPCEKVGRLWLAGGFGNFMNRESARAIGLIPPALADKAVSAGNAAGAGARMALLSAACRRRTEAIVSLASPIELSGREDFQDRYIEEMTFPDREADS